MIRDKAFYKEFFSLYIALVLQNIIVLLVNLLDNIMIGAYSETALSGVAAVNQIQFIYQQIIFGCADALVVIGSQYWGMKKTDDIKRLVPSALCPALLTGAALFLLACLNPSAMVSVFTESADIRHQGVLYINTIKYTYIPFALTNILLAALRSSETVKIAFYTSLSALIINCSVNYCLIGGNLGFPEMGVKGAAIGTVIARLFELFAVAFYVLFKDKKLNIQLREFLKVDRNLFIRYFKVALPVVSVAAMFGVSTALQTVILGHMTDAAIAANSVASTLFQTLKVASVGASAATAVVIGKAVGTGDMKKVKDYTKTLQIIFLIIGFCTSVALFLLRAPILSLYSLDAETKRLANLFLLVLCVTGFGTAYEMPALTGIVRSGQPSFILKNDFISIWLIVLPASFLAAFYFKANPVTVVFLLNSDQIFKCAAAAIKTNSYTWVKRIGE